MFILTYEKLYKKIRSLQNSAYSDGILTIVEDENERGFGVRRYNDFYIYGEVGWAGDTLDDFGFDMGSSLKISKDIDDVIKGYIDYASDDFCNDCDYNEDESTGFEIVITWKHTIHKYNVSSEKYFKLFKDGEFSIRLNLDDYDASKWEVK